MGKYNIIDFEKEFEELDELLVANNLNNTYNNIILTEENEFERVRKFPQLTSVDLTVCVISAIISAIIDIVFVGTPDVVKIYKGGENFDGSILTGLLRKIGTNNNNGDLCKVLQWFSDKCKVPYDISINKDALTPNNHRLRSFAHDPLFGLLFAVVDIIMGTTTCVDNHGLLKIIVNDKGTTIQQKIFSVIYYVGHLISDVCTARGLPIPGSFLLEFITVEIGDVSIAKMAEEMYINGYDLRHLASMSAPVITKNMIIDSYLKLSAEPQSSIEPLYQREKVILDEKLKKCKMRLIANSIASTGNLLKFILPPNSGNPASINIVQWFSLFKNTVEFTKASMRDISAEQAIFNREEINATWTELENMNLDNL